MTFTWPPLSSLVDCRPLGGDGVLVWILETSALSCADAEKWLGLLDRNERQRADRFKCERDRMHYIAAHAAARRVLSLLTRQHAREICIRCDADGRQYLGPGPSGIPRPDFNITHTFGLVAGAASFSGRVGVDAEYMGKERFDPLRLARACFAESEIAQVERAHPDERTEAFFRIWTLKEAYLKSTGLGLSRDLDTFAFARDPIRLIEPTIADEGERWRFAQAKPTREHVLSLAIHCGNPSEVAVQGIVVPAQGMLE